MIPTTCPTAQQPPRTRRRPPSEARGAEGHPPPQAWAPPAASAGAPRRSTAQACAMAAPGSALGGGPPLCRCNASPPRITPEPPFPAFPLLDSRHHPCLFANPRRTCLPLPRVTCTPASPLFCWPGFVSSTCIPPSATTIFEHSFLPTCPPPAMSCERNLSAPPAPRAARATCIPTVFCRPAPCLGCDTREPMQPEQALVHGRSAHSALHARAPAGGSVAAAWAGGG